MKTISFSTTLARLAELHVCEQARREIWEVAYKQDFIYGSSVLLSDYERLTTNDTIVIDMLFARAFIRRHGLARARDRVWWVAWKLRANVEYRTKAGFSLEQLANESFKKRSAVTLMNHLSQIKNAYRNARKKHDPRKFYQ